jgi:hypothetical protein
MIAGGFFNDVIRGILPGRLIEKGAQDTGKAAEKAAQDARKAAEKAAQGTDRTQIPQLNVPFRVQSMATPACLDVPAERVKSRDEYDALVRGFPPPTFVVEPGVCPPLTE